MSRININLNNEVVSAEVIRYFTIDNNNYLIYSLNEVDEQQYVKLYITKVINNAGMSIGESVSDEAEWDAVKEGIKIIIKSNNEGNPVSNDLDYASLDGFTVLGNRIFKLSSALTEILNKDKPVFEKQEEEKTEEIETSENLGVENQVEETVMPNIIRESLEPEVYGPVAQPVAELEPVNEDPLSSYQLNTESVKSDNLSDNDNNNDNNYQELLLENEKLKEEVNRLNEKLNNILNIING